MSIGSFGRDLRGTAHVKVEVAGDASAVEKLHYLLHYLDSDWPYVRHRWQGEIAKCKRCEGRVYYSPRLTPGNVKSAARQMGTEVKIVKWAPFEKCRGVEGKV